MQFITKRNRKTYQTEEIPSFKKIDANTIKNRPENQGGLMD
jgi:hypothetical protein